MAGYPWFRIYNEARNDAKLRSLSDRQFRIWFNLLCYSNEQESRGTIECDLEVLAVEVANEDVDALKDTLDRCIKLKMIDADDDCVSFINFDDRQYDNPSDKPASVNDRVRKHREQKKKQACSDNVTPCNEMKRAETKCIDTDTDTDTEITTSTTTRACEAIKHIENTIGLVTQSIAEEVVSFVDDGVEDELICKAIDESIAQGANNWAYARSILQRCVKSNIKTLQAFKLDQERQKQKKADKPATARGKPAGKTDKDWEQFREYEEFSRSQGFRKANETG